jgi:hypothetical protein
MDKNTICSFAQSHLGGRPFTNVDTDAAPNAAVARLWFDSARKEFLRSHSWNFATVRATLTSNVIPEFEFNFQYSLPNDCLKVISLEDIESQYVVEGRKLLAQPIYESVSTAVSGSVNIKYIYDNTDYSSWPNDAINAFSFLLASYMAQDVNGPDAGGGRNAELRKIYEQMIVPLSKSRDSKEMRQKLVTKDQYSEVINARYGAEY